MRRSCWGLDQADLQLGRDTAGRGDALRFEFFLRIVLARDRAHLFCKCRQLIFGWLRLQRQQLGLGFAPMELIGQLVCDFFGAGKRLVESAHVRGANHRS